MSYIRCLSNPESVYAWGDVSGEVNFTHGVLPPNASSSELRIPTRIFEQLGRRWVDRYQPDKLTYRGATIEEVVVDWKTGEIIPPMAPCKKGCEPEYRRKKLIAWRPCRSCWRKDFKIRKNSRYVQQLSYKGQFVRLWNVTWYYIASGIRGRFRK